MNNLNFSQHDLLLFVVVAVVVLFLFNAFYYGRGWRGPATPISGGSSALNLFPLLGSILVIVLILWFAQIITGMIGGTLGLIIFILIVLRVLGFI